MSNKRITNFSQKGFTGSFLEFMKRLERNELCCLDFLDKVYTQNSATVQFTGSGTQDDPLIASASSSVGTLSNANNGLSLFNPSTVQLGQAVNAAGNPAAILNNREIPLNTFNVAFSGVSGNLLIGSTTDTGNGERLQVTGKFYSSLNALIHGITIGIPSAGTTNNILGSAALASNTTGTENTAVGNNALNANTTGSFNTAIGNGALALATGSTINVAVGRFSMGNATGSFSRNVAMGVGTLFVLSTGGRNTAIGHGTLQGVTTGSNNTALGVGDSAAKITTGSDNTLVGTFVETNAGIRTGSGNTLVGSRIGAGIADVSNYVVISDGSASGIYRFYSPSNGNVILNGNTDNGYSLQIKGGLTLGSTVLPGTPVNYALETDATHLYITLAGTRYQLDQQGSIISVNASGPVTITGAKSGTTYTNSGASAQVVFNLPVATVGLVYEFINARSVNIATGVQLKANGTDTISTLVGTSSVGGTATSGAIGDSIKLVCDVAGKWQGIYGAGDWATA